MSDANAFGLQRSGRVDAGGEQSFLSRWSRRKLGQDAEQDPAWVAPAVDAQSAQAPPATPTEPVDPRTGKPISELTDADMPDIETLDENSNLAVYMAAKVSQALRMKALTKVFHTAKFNQVCLCAEYADDYTKFVPLGDIVPHDLQQAIAREAGKLLERFTAQGIEISPEEAHARAAAQFRGEAAAVPAALADGSAAGPGASVRAVEAADPPQQAQSGRPSAPPQPETT